MKKAFLFVITLLVILSLVACDNNNGYSTEIKDWESTPYDKVNNFDGVTMTVKEGSVSSTGLIVIFENNSNKQGVYGEFFTLEKENKGVWYQVPTIIEEYGFEDIGYDLASSKSQQFKIDWDWLYGKLDTGEYRIIKNVLDFRSPGNYDEYFLAAQFSVN